MIQTLKALFGRTPELTPREKSLIESKNADAASEAAYAALQRLQEALKLELTAADYELQTLRRERGHHHNARHATDH